jgi:hypothetical protein
MNFIVASMKSNVQTVNDANFGEFLTSNVPEKKKILLFTDKSSPPPLFKAISNKFPNVDFGMVSMSTTKITKQFDVLEGPAIVFVKTSEGPTEQAIGEIYKGDKTFDDIAWFIKKKLKS